MVNGKTPKIDNWEKFVLFIFASEWNSQIVEWLLNDHPQYNMHSVPLK